MINVQLEALPQGREQEFRAWVIKPQFALLLEILEARENQNWCKAFNDAIKSGTGNLKLESANEYLLQSQRYNEMIKILKEIRDQPLQEPYHIAKLLSHGNTT